MPTTISFSRMNKLKTLVTMATLFLLATGCQTIAAEYESAIGYYDENARVKKVLAKGIIKFQFHKTPRREEGQLEIICSRGQFVEGERRLKIAKGQHIVDYAPWRELIELPIIGPISLVFLPFNLLSWLFGFRGGKLQVINTLYMLNPGQNSTIWYHRYEYTERPGKYVKNQWFKWKPLSFEILELRVKEKKVPVKILSQGEKKIATVPFAKLFPQYEEPIMIHLKAKVDGKILDGKIKFVFDDTPQIVKKRPEEDTRDYDKAKKVIEGHFKVAGFYYKKGEFKKAIKYYSQVISGYRWLLDSTKGLTPEHPYYRSLLFRGLARVRLYSPELKKLDPVPYAEAWRAFSDMESFVRLSPWNPLRGFVEIYLRPLGRKVFGIPEEGKKEEKKKDPQEEKKKKPTSPAKDGKKSPGKKSSSPPKKAQKTGPEKKEGTGEKAKSAVGKDKGKK